MQFREEDTSWVWTSTRPPDIVVELRWVHSRGVWLQGLGAEGGAVQLRDRPVERLRAPDSQEDGAELAQQWFNERDTTPIGELP